MGDRGGGRDVKNSGFSTFIQYTGTCTLKKKKNMELYNLAPCYLMWYTVLLIKNTGYLIDDCGRG